MDPLKKNKNGSNKPHELLDMDVSFVSLVTAGANRQKSFLVVKEDEDTSKSVPAADASNDDKNSAQEGRAKKYGIEILETNSNLSYPSGSPTTESLYGDPVNLKYPFGKDDNKPDLGRLRNAVARFKQNYEEYKDDKSRSVVYERIVRAAMAEGVEVSYDENDPVDQLLPADLKDELMKQPNDEGAPQASKGGNAEDEDSADLSSWLEEAGDKINMMAMDANMASVLDAQPLPPVSGQSGQQTIARTVGDRENVPPGEVEVREEVSEMKKALDEQTAEVKKLKEQLKREKIRNDKLSKGIGGATAIQHGEVITTPTAKTRTKGAFHTGGDIAAEVEADTK